MFVTVGLVVYDFAAFFNPEICNTISCVSLEWSKEHPTIILLSGILMGHLFVPQTRVKILGRAGWVYFGKPADCITEEDIETLLKQEK